MEGTSRSGNGRTSVGHTCLLYSSTKDFVAGVGEFVLDGLAGGAAVLVALPTARLGLLHRGLDVLADRVDYLDMSTVGRNPGRVLPALLTFANRHRRRPVRIVGEPIWAGRSPAEIVEAIRHEALLNLAFAGTAVEVLCPYETWPRTWCPPRAAPIQRS